MTPSRATSLQLIASLKKATAEFETNYDLLLDSTGADAASPQRDDPSSIENVLFAKPFHLDYFSMGLAANGWRFISAIETELGGGASGTGYLAGKERAQLDETVANATLAGYTELGERIDSIAKTRLQKTLNVHQTLFYATIAIIILVALFIFRPMSEMILRRTHDLVDARNSMAFIAVHDGLTGLHNRTFLTDHFDTLIKGTHRRGERLAVLQLDLDRFKQINDTLGHAAGDYVLVVTAQRMRDSCRASDLCVRLGGDEFVMILSGRRHRRGHQQRRQAHPCAHQRADQFPRRDHPAGRQRRHRRLSDRRRQRQGSARARRPCAVFGQEARRRRLLVLLRRAPAGAGAPQAARTRPQDRHRGAGLQRLLPAAGLAQQRRASPASKRWCAGTMRSAA